MFNILSPHPRFMPAPASYPPHANRAVIRWLFLVAGLIFIMSLIGAATRLTESGLSITEWKPITGALPPLTANDWDRAFTLYQATPEYHQKNLGMSLTEFKTIYFWEWTHRLWGRMIGFAFLLPFLFFAARGYLSRRLTLGLIGIFALGGLQGGIGWFMVQSGLIDRPNVNHYRLALHLFCALLLYGLILWTAFTLRLQTAKTTTRGPWALRLHAYIALALLATTITWGAFVAGLDAGLIYNEFPTMGPGRLMPAEMWHLTPAWLNLFENHAAVQFTHRALAITTIMTIMALGVHGILTLPRAETSIFLALPIVALFQGALGVLTLLSGVNILAGVAHQGTALILLAATIAALRQVTMRRSR